MIDREEGTDLAKVSPHILSAERFGLHLATHLVSKYAHIHKAFVTIEQLGWTRIVVDGQAHNHSFLRGGDEKRLVHVKVDGSLGKDRLAGSVSAGINDLLGQVVDVCGCKVLTFFVGQFSNRQALRLRASSGTNTRR